MPRDEVARALQTGCPVRLHLCDGEVVVARILDFDADELRFAPIQSSRPERYAVCDSTGFVLRFAELEKAVLVSPAGGEDRPERGPAAGHRPAVRRRRRRRAQ
jgi:hypothetical protein